MAVITFVIVLIWWNPQKLITYYYDDCERKIEQIKSQKNDQVEDVD